jgi:hypothetical protein
MISVYFNGRLGNQLFQYIFCRIAAFKNNCNFYIPKTKEEGINFYDYCRYIFGIYLELPRDLSNPHFWIGENIFDIDFGSNDNFMNKILLEPPINDITDGTFLNGFFQSDSYMIEYENEIKNNWLKIKDDLKNKSIPLLEKYNINEYCYIHFRGGDYKSIDKYYLPKSYYQEAILKIKELQPKIKFLVITDDLDESKKMFPEFESVSNSMEEDFYLLTKSKYLIIPNSSFSWWAAWLNQNEPITIAPDRWFNYNSGDNFDPIGIKSSKFTYI